MKCVILCAGRGHRMGGGRPKALIPINGKPLVYHVMDMWETSVDEFIFVVGYKWQEVTKELPRNAKFVVQEPQIGLADAVFQARKALEETQFVVALGDCLQVGKWVIPKNIKLGVGVWETKDKENIRRSYSVETKDKLVCKVIEKPKNPPNDYCGMGTYFFDSRVFNYIKKTKINPLRNEKEITDTIQLMIDSGEPITPVVFKGRYLNVTYWDDVAKAEELLS